MTTPLDTRRSLHAARAGVLLAILVLALVPAALHPSPAHAAPYDIYSCSQPDNADAPTEGWTSFSDNSSMPAEDNCAQGGELSAGLLGDVTAPVGAEAGWTFTAPAGTQVKEASLFWNHSNSDNEDTDSATAFEWFQAPSRNSKPFASCVHSQGCCCSSGLFRFSPEDLLIVPAEDLEPEFGGTTAITMTAGCTTDLGGGDGHCEGGAYKFATYSGIGGATITL
jgi:hypothetical protein